MSFTYQSVEEAMALSGLRMVVVGGVPSPWGEAAKGIFHIKGLDWTAVRLDYKSEALKEWTGLRNGPVAMYGKEPPRAGWAEILLLAERLAPEPPLLPADAGARALAFGLSHEICGEQGLCWTRRIQLIHAGLQGRGGFIEPVARYLAKRYGHSAEAGEASGLRVQQLLAMLASRLKARQAEGSAYYLGDSMTAVDVYSATCMALFKPLPANVCAMDPGNRAAFETLDAQTAAALDPALIAHRDMMYARHLELPLSL